MTIAMFLLVVSLLFFGAALHFYPMVICNRIDRIKTEWQKDNITLAEMRKLLKF